VTGGRGGGGRPVRRLGVILTSVNTVIEPELSALPLPEASFHFARARMVHGTAAELEEMARRSTEVAGLLADARPERIWFASTSASFHGGQRSDRRLAAAIEAACSVPVVTAATAVVGALRALGVGRVGLATPYLAWVGEAEAAFLAGHGLEVVRRRNLGLQDGHVMAGLGPDEIAGLGRGVAAPEAEAVLLSCTNLWTLDVVGRLEAELGRPVVSSTSAGLWALWGSDPRLAGLGRLFARPPRV
jgi:maleate isomerase